MKKIIVLLIALSISNIMIAQEPFSGNGLTIGGVSNWHWHIYRPGNGSFNQSLLFATAGSTSEETIRARLTQWGGLSLGTTAINHPDLLAVAGNAYFSGNIKANGNMYINDIANKAGLKILFDNDTSNNGSDVDLTINTNSGSPIVDWYIQNWAGSYVFNRGMNDGTGATTRKNLFRIESSGDIVVPQGKAIIDGMVNCEEVKVEVLNVPDYVFEKDYNLRSLEDTETYINKNKHLPEIPSAKQMEANGVELGDMNMLLLKKIEELTLYTIEQEKLLNSQTEQLSKQQKEIQTLKKENETLKSFSKRLSALENQLKSKN